MAAEVVVTSDLGGSPPLNGASRPDARAACWHCMLKEITIKWRPSTKYKGAFAGYVHQAKVCAIDPHPHPNWTAKVFLPFERGYVEAVCEDRETAEQQALKMVREWFAQLDHE